MTLALLMCLTVSPIEGFTAYDCSNRSNIVEAYSLLEPDACANMGKEGEVETTGLRLYTSTKQKVVNYWFYSLMNKNKIYI